MTIALDVPAPPRTLRGRMHWMLRDGWTITRREFGHLRREPGQLVAALIFPAIMVLLFGYIFGSAIKVPGGSNYREYLLPGLFAMTAIVGVMASALLTSKDVAEGVMDRFRSMPMARSAVPFGRTAADLRAAVVAALPHRGSLSGGRRRGWGRRSDGVGEGALAGADGDLEVVLGRRERAGPAGVVGAGGVVGVVEVEHDATVLDGEAAAEGALDGVGQV